MNENECHADDTLRKISLRIPRSWLTACDAAGLVPVFGQKAGQYTSAQRLSMGRFADSLGGTKHLHNENITALMRDFLGNFENAPSPINAVSDDSSAEDSKNPAFLSLSMPRSLVCRFEDVAEKHDLAICPLMATALKSALHPYFPQPV